MKTTKDYNHMEKKEAKKDGAQLVPNSGRGKLKGDAMLPGYLIDYKFNSKSFTLNLAAWEKHSKDAWKQGHRDPMIIIKFGNDRKVAIIDYDVIKELL